MKFRLSPLAHFLFWIMMLLSPLFFFKGQDQLDWIHFARHSLMTLTMVCLFYSNYLFIAKRYFNKEGMKKFAVYNTCIIAFFCCVNFAGHRFSEPYIEKAREQRRIELEERIRNAENGKDPIVQTPQQKQQAHDLWDIILNIFAFLCMIGTAIAILSVEEIYHEEEKRMEEEQKKTEAELKMLKNQLNPHFLFNTLNNIYALISIDTEKSQTAVLELSKLLRYMLYESDQKEVPLSKEIEFINNYVELMRIRLSAKTEVVVKTDIQEDESITVAPQLFISLIENAFKHGVSNQQPSFIHFSIEVKNGSIICTLENSYFPKSEDHDKSGSGIGIENMKRRLELIYPNRHTYTMGIENNVYKTQITINKNTKA